MHLHPWRSDSRKPVGAPRLKVLRQRRFEDQFGPEYLAARTRHAEEFVKDLLTKRIEIENSVYKRHIDARITQRYLFRGRLHKREVNGAIRGARLARSSMLPLESIPATRPF